MYVPACSGDDDVIDDVIQNTIVSRSFLATTMTKYCFPFQSCTNKPFKTRQHIQDLFGDSCVQISTKIKRMSSIENVFVFLLANSVEWDYFFSERAVS